MSCIRECHMHRKGASMFWGVLVTLIGISILLQVVFKVNIPVARTFFAIMLIYWGIRLLLGGFGMRHVFHQDADNATVFSASNVNIEYSESKSKEHSVVFGKSAIDLSKIQLDKDNYQLTINTVFGETEVLIPANMPYVIYSTTVMGETKLPQGNIAFMGESKEKSEGLKEEMPHLQIRIQTVFGSTKVIEKK